MKFDIKNRKVLVVIAVISALSIGGIALTSKNKEEINYVESQFVELYSVSGSERVFINFLATVLLADKSSGLEFTLIYNNFFIIVPSFIYYIY